jgi:DNA-binding CsgD family transcriptional regulator
MDSDARSYVMHQPAGLSPRELECLQWVSRGKSSGDIGSILGLSPRTIDSYLEKACSKLRVRTRIEAVALAVRTGTIDPL